MNLKRKVKRIRKKKKRNKIHRVSLLQEKRKYMYSRVGSSRPAIKELRTLRIGPMYDNPTFLARLTLQSAELTQ